jgi:sterol 3beta-glucosyltransferase
LSDTGRYQPKPIDIENKRWDPLSAGSSTLLNTLVDLKNDGKNVFIQPYQEIQKASTLRKENSGAGPSGASAASLAAGKGLGKMSGGLAKGIILDLPVAMADGFHALPVLYGDKPMAREAVTDWKSGAVVGGKVTTS